MARARKTTSTRQPRKSTASSTRRSGAVAAATPALSATSAESVGTAAAAADGVAPDLAGGLRSFLDAIETEVRAVSALSERIDGLIRQVNAARNEQAERLLALDALRSAATDGGLTSFLDKLIRPRMTRVTEEFPERLTS